MSKKRIKSLEEIQSNLENTLVYWNEPDMKKYCGKTLELESSTFSGEPVWRLIVSSSTVWTFAESWVEDEFLEKELFEI